MVPLEAVAGDLPNISDEPEPKVERRDDGAFLINGTIPISEVADLLGLHGLPHGDYLTLAGFVLLQLQHVAQVDAQFTWGNGAFRSKIWMATGSRKFFCDPLRALRKRWCKSGCAFYLARSVFAAEEAEHLLSTGCNRQWGLLTLGQCPARVAGASRKAHRGRRVVLESLLMFLVLIGSFALVGLLVRFSENVLRPTDDVAAPDHRNNGWEYRNRSFSRADARLGACPSNAKSRL